MKLNKKDRFFKTFSRLCIFSANNAIRGKVLTRILFDTKHNQKLLVKQRVGENVDK